MITFEVHGDGSMDSDELLREVAEEMANDLRQVQCDVHGTETGGVVVRVDADGVALGGDNACCEAYVDKVIAAMRAFE